SCSTTQLVRRGEARMELILGTTPSWSLLIIQVFLGIIFFAHGAQLVFGSLGGQGLRATIHYFWDMCPTREMRVPPLQRSLMWLYSAGHTETRAIMHLKRCVR